MLLFVSTEIKKMVTLTLGWILEMQLVAKLIIKH